MSHEEQKKEILRELVKSEKDTLEKLKDLVIKSKELFWIEETSGNVVLARKRVFSQQQKVLLQLVGKYFALELGITESSYSNLDELKRITGVGSRAMSPILGALMKSSYIIKEKGGYKIKHYMIEEIIDNILKERKIERKSRKVGKRGGRKKLEEAPKEEIKSFDSSGLKKLEEKIGAKEEQMRHIYDFEENDAKIITEIEGKNESNKQLIGTLLYLTVFKYCFYSKRISSRELREKLEDLGIKSLVNLSTNLNEHRKFIVHEKGKRGDTNTFYKITLPGEKKGFELIKNIIKNEFEK